MKSPGPNKADKGENNHSSTFQTNSLFLCQKWHIISSSKGLQGLEAREQSYFSSGLLIVGTTDILDWIIPCCGGPSRALQDCRIFFFCSIPGLYPLDASSPSSQVMTTVYDSIMEALFSLITTLGKSLSPGNKELYESIEDNKWVSSQKPPPMD